MDLVEEFTTSTRQGDGCLWYLWTRNVEDPCEFILLEAFREDFVEEHLKNPLIAKIEREWPQALTGQPRMIRATIPGDDWEPLLRMRVPAVAEASDG
jgi:quinol monooxygenase YgiN